MSSYPAVPGERNPRGAALNGRDVEDSRIADAVKRLSFWKLFRAGLAGPWAAYQIEADLKRQVSPAARSTDAGTP